MENSREQMIATLREAVCKMKESLALMEKELAFLEGDKSVFVDEEFDISLDDAPLEEPSRENVAPKQPEEPAPYGDLFGMFADDYGTETPAAGTQPLEAPRTDTAKRERDIPAEPESINEISAAHLKPALMDVMEDKFAWRTDIPGTPVHNILSAVSLNDRVMFINTLFEGDPLRFQETVSLLNSMESFEKAEVYVLEHCTDWDLNSDTVYRFMMAVKRKLR